MQNSNIGFIGCGNIANAIISGILGSGYIKPKNLHLFDLDKSKCEDYVSAGATLHDTSRELVSACDFVFLTIKPQIYDIVLNEIKNVADTKCLIAVAAGITINHIKEVLGYEASVIRVMPNTPLTFGEGASALVFNPPVTKEQFSFVKGMFECSGVAVQVDEKHINTVTAISGSAPAFVMRFANDFISFAVSNGLDKETAEALVLQAVKGSAEMVKHSSESIDTLIKNVTSPNGTTEAGLNAMNSLDFDNTVDTFLKATLKRAEELTL